MIEIMKPRYIYVPSIIATEWYFYEITVNFYPTHVANDNRVKLKLTGIREIEKTPDTIRTVGGLVPKRRTRYSVELLIKKFLEKVKR